VAESVEHVVKTNIQESPIRVQGQQLAEWVGIDYGDIIVHVFIPELRSFFNIDNLWSDAKIVNIPNLD
jgi:ribosome-associated protein